MKGKMKGKKGLFIHLFHGRDNVTDNLEDWGEDGPTFGPFEEVLSTYATHIRGIEKGGADRLWLSYTEDCVHFGGKYYGDYAVFFGTMISEKVVRSVSGINYTVAPIPETKGE